MVAYSFKKQFVAPIQAGLGILPMFENGFPEFTIDDGSKIARPFDSTIDLDPPIYPKLQTIRAVGKRRHARPGEELQLYTAMRTKSCKLIGRARCRSVDDIIIVFRPKRQRTRALAIESIIVGGKAVPHHLFDLFARADGFETVYAMADFWIRENNPPRRWRGVLVRWEPL